MECQEACFIQKEEEIYERMNYLPKEIIMEAIENTLLIGKMCEDYTIEQPTIIPKIELPEFEIEHLFKPAYEKYEYIEKTANSKYKQDRYAMYLIEKGFRDKLMKPELTHEKFHQILARINVELGELWQLSEELNQRMTDYYISVRQLISIIWKDDCGNSIVPAGRGSSSGFILNFLWDITQINPLEYGVEIPHWRHLHHSRPDIGALDIDIDTESNKRQRILKSLKRKFGEERILQVATFGTQGSRSAILTACRGLGLDSDIGLHLSGLIPFERGQNWSIKDCLYGNTEKNRKPVKEFINEIDKYPKLQSMIEKVEGKIDKRSIHAGGIILFPENYVKSNAMMKAPNGTPITQFSLDDCQSVGNIKYDLLTIEGADRIRATFDLLLKHGEIEWKGSLKATYDYYLHPDNIDMENPELYKMLGSGEVASLFQFSTEQGIQAATKTKPTNLIETAAANSLMRLMSDSGGEQPIDTFVRYKNDISLWYEEMKRHGLNENEILVMEEYLLPLSGISDTQEVVMRLAMDNRIAGFDIIESNKLRKLIAKRDEKLLEVMENEFYSKGLSLGNRKEILSYVWDVQIKRMLGYAFSICHTISYSIIALQELTLNYNYNPIYWQTACLSVNSGSLEVDEDTKSSTGAYGKVASAISEIQQSGVTVSLPDINKAEYSFTPDVENNKIIFGLRGLIGVGDSVVDTIIQNRPYTSFEDFYSRLYTTKLVTNSHMVQLIKAGCFDEFDDRTTTMQKYVNLTFSPNKKLSTANLKNLINLNLIPNKYALHIRYYKFKEHIYSRSIGKLNDRKTKNRLFLLDNVSTEFLIEHFSEDSIVDYRDGQPIILEALFDKEYDKKMEVIKEWLKEDSTLHIYNNKLREQHWIDTTKGIDNVSAWEMSSLSYYNSPHELANVDKVKYGIKDFYSLPENPLVVNEYEWGNRKMKEFDICRIAGTVLDKDKNKHTVTILTTDGVVTCKFYGNQYSSLDRQLSVKGSDGKKQVIEKGWFVRGNLVILTGYRRGNQFIPKRYKNSVYNTTIALIDNVLDNGELSLITERAEI